MISPSFCQPDCFIIHSLLEDTQNLQVCISENIQVCDDDTKTMVKDVVAMVRNHLWPLCGPGEIIFKDAFIIKHVFSFLHQRL